LLPHNCNLLRDYLHYLLPRQDGSPRQHKPWEANFIKSPSTFIVRHISSRVVSILAPNKDIHLKRWCIHHMANWRLALNDHNFMSEILHINMFYFNLSKRVAIEFYDTLLDPSCGISVVCQTAFLEGRGRISPCWRHGFTLHLKLALSPGYSNTSINWWNAPEKITHHHSIDRYWCVCIFISRKLYSQMMRLQVLCIELTRIYFRLVIVVLKL